MPRAPEPPQSSPRAPGPESLEALRDRARTRSLLGPLQQLVGDFRERMQAALAERGHELPPALARVAVHLDSRGSRLTDLADRAGISKQAMGKFVAELEELGYVERADDETDGRAYLIRFSETGRAFLGDAVASVDEIWEHYAALVGEAGLVRLRRGVELLVKKLEERAGVERPAA